MILLNQILFVGEKLKSKVQLQPFHDDLYMFHFDVKIQNSNIIINLMFS